MGIIAMARDNYFILGGVDSRDYDMIVSCEDAFTMPERDVDVFEIPGRNGDLIVDNGRFRNVDITYQVVIENGFAEKINAFKQALGKLRGYARLEDTFDFDAYRMANVKNVKIEELGMRYNGGTFEIKVNCKPQKYLKSGENELPVWFLNVSNSTMHSGNFKFDGYIDRAMTITMHCPTGVSVTVECNSMDDSEAIVSTHTYTCGNEESAVLEFYPTARYGNIILSASDVSGVSATLDCMLVRGADPDDKTQYSVPMVSELTLSNPTGYATKPLFEFSGFAATDISIVNYVDGQISETYRVMCLDNVPGTIVMFSKAFLDCDLMYMHDGSGGNLASYLRVISATDRTGRNLVFPEFGTDTIKIRSVSTLHSGYSPEWLPVMYITPRWWTV